MKNKYALFLFCFILSLDINAQIGITNNSPNNNPTHLVSNVLVGGGVTISNIQFSGDNQQIGYFSNGNSIGMPSGIVMSSGHAMDADLGGFPGSTNTPSSGIQCTTNPNTVCNDLYTVANSVPVMLGQWFSVSSINDMCVLEFDFIPESDTISFNYSFGSEEYLTYVNTAWNDVFGFFISGPGITGPYSSPTGFPNGSQNIAIVPNSNPPLPITVSSVHPGYNSQYYNSGNTTISYNGYTDVFTAIAVVQPCQTYHIRLAIADGSDDWLDSGVFLEANSFSATSATIDTNSISIVSDTLFVECIDSSLVLEVGLNNPNYSILWNTGQSSLSILVGPGQYFYTATNGNCVLYSDTVAVFNQTSIVEDTIVTQISCFGLTDGIIDLSVVGGSPPYNFFWWDSVSGYTSTSEDISNLPEGDYHCFITDNNGCNGPVMSVSITEPQELLVSSLFSDVSCFGLNDGLIDLSISGGNPVYNVSWTSANGYTSSSSNISNLGTDIYTATITDANGCGPITETVLITEPPDITLFGTSYDNSCFNAGDGSIDLVTTGNNLIFNWTGPSLFTSNQEDISNLIAGTYTVTITDSNSCVGPSASYFVNEPSDIVVTYLTNNVSCFAGSDGSIDLSITGGAGNYNTIWTGVNGYFNISEDIFTLSASDYSYTITDANGCSPSVNNSPITITEPLGVQLSSVVTDETCYGDSDGSIDMTLTGSSSYTFSWVGPNSFSSTDLDISSLEVGTYNLQITDLNNCIFLHSETIDIGNIINIDTFINNISCNGYSDGNIVLVTPNSLTPTFSWTGPNLFSSTSNQLLNLESGNYSVVVNDETNCPTQINLSISDPSTLSFTSILTDESCEGYQDGQIEISVSGGTPNYSYVWSNGNNSSLNSNLLNGEYILNIIDANNCIVTDTFTVDLFLFDTTRNITNVSCYGDSDGSADLEIVGGNPPFTYNWSPPGSTQDLINVLSGVYTVNITDLTNCTIVRDVIITEPQQLAVVTNTTDILCFGDSTGTISSQINGGVSPYIMDWAMIDTNALIADYYIFTVTDNNNCKFSDSVEILQNDSMQISNTITNVSCFGFSDASIELQIAQGTGTPPYNYLWSGPNNYTSTDEDIYNLEFGNYYITVTDANLCSQQLILYVDQPQQLSQTTVISTSNYSGYNVRCKGENSAWAQLTITGGYPPFSFLWDNGSISDSIYNLYAGNYSVVISDSLGCTENVSLNLNEPSTYVSANVNSLTDYNGYNISCFEGIDGAITASAVDGVPPYSYLWNTSETTKSISNLESAYYEVFVYDNNQCLAIDSLTLTEPTELIYQLDFGKDTCSKSIGWAEVIPSGGVPNYSGFWSNSSIGLNVYDLSEGEYYVEVSDANSCIKIDTVNIENLVSPIADFESYPYHKRLLDQKNEPFYFVDLTQTFWTSVKTWNWSLGDNSYAYDSVVSHIYNENGEYTVLLEITTESDCIDTISKKVLVDEYSFFIPNSFIPSSNLSENKIFRGYGIGIENYELKIFSRWGELIFETQNLDEGWNGTYYSSENACPNGVYTYTVFIENIYGEIFEYQGQVKLLR